VAMDVMLTGRPLSAERAHQLGLVSRLSGADDIDEIAREVAEQVADNAPFAVRNHPSCRGQGGDAHR